MLNLKNFLFDLDGVLVNACDWHYETLNESLKFSGNTPISLSDHVEKYNGLPTKIKLSMLNIDLNQHDLIINKKAEFLDKYIEERCQIDEEKIELFEHLKNKKGRIACVTNSVRHTVESVLEKMGIRINFDAVVSNEDVRNNKPDPEPYDYTVSLLKINPAECLIVEDSPKGFMAAALSKVSVIWKVPDANYVTLANYKNIFEDNHE